MTTLNPPPEPTTARLEARPRVALCAAAVVLAANAASAASSGLLSLETPVVVIQSVEDPATHAVCDGQGLLVFGLSDTGLVTLRIHGGTPLTGAVDARPPTVLESVLLEAGRHSIALSSGVLAEPLGSAAFELEARETRAAPPEKRTGRILGEVVNRQVLTVGRTFLQGVDLLDGHLTLQATDIELEGRYHGLEVTRTYSSAHRNHAGLIGVGWSFNYASSLTPAESCGLYVVTTADGSSQTFRSADGGRTFTPQVGYHTELHRRPGGAFDFVDKSATRHHFAPPSPGTGRTRRLEYIQEPHGDRIAFRYDDRERLVEVSEVHYPARGVRVLARTLVLTWTSAGGLPRVRSAEAVGLGQRVEYDYDGHGNLLKATLWDTEFAGPLIERYGYSSQAAEDAGRLASWAEFDGTRTEYRYAAVEAEVPLDGGPLRALRGGRQQPVQEAVELPPKGGRVATRFAYDLSRAASGLYRTTITGVSSPQVYTMNRRGNPVQIEETDTEGRRVFDIEWAEDDILKLGEHDNRGYRAQYGYDARGNLTSSRERADAEAAETLVMYRYDPTFNILIHKTDEAGLVSKWRVDPKTGDLLRMHEAGSQPIRYVFDRHGNLIEKLEPGGRRTLFLDHDSYGNPTRVIHPSGQVERREFDLRGRLLESE